jgi:hypothetical protein
MVIQHADKYRWMKRIHPDIFPDFGKNATAKLKQLIRQAPELGISHEIVPLTMEHFTWFVPLYNASIATKQNPNPHNIVEATLLKPTHSYTYYILILREHGTPIGGTIFSVREDYVSFAFRTYPTNWLSAQVRCSPALYAEYLVTEHTLAQGFTELIHGKDKHPYGMNSAIGVALFKLSVGCRPEPQIDFTAIETDTDTLTTDTLLFSLPAPTEPVRECYLVCSEANRDRYNQLLAYEDLVITWIPRTVKD